MVHYLPESTKGITMKMTDDVHAELLDMYKEKITTLQDYLEKDLSHWLST